MTVRFSPLHEWEPWKVLATGFSAGAVLVLAMIVIGIIVLRAAGLGS